MHADRDCWLLKDFFSLFDGALSFFQVTGELTEGCDQREGERRSLSRLFAESEECGAAKCSLAARMLVLGFLMLFCGPHDDISFHFLCSTQTQVPSSPIAGAISPHGSRSAH